MGFQPGSELGRLRQIRPFTSKNSTADSHILTPKSSVPIIVMNPIEIVYFASQSVLPAGRSALFRDPRTREGTGLANPGDRQGAGKLFALPYRAEKVQARAEYLKASLDITS